MTFMPNVTNGKKAGFIGEMEDIGVAGSGCDPEYKKVAIAAAQKEWEIGDWQIPLEMCYTDLENTIAKYCLKTGTNIGDLTSTEYMDGIVLPKLSEAMMKMMWRFTWFGDKSAASVTGGGQITDGVNIELFKTCDGFFKRLFAICTNNAEQQDVYKRQTYDFLYQMATSPVVDMFMGYDDNGNARWMAVNVSVGNFVKQRVRCV